MAAVTSGEKALYSTSFTYPNCTELKQVWLDRLYTYLSDPPNIANVYFRKTKCDYVVPLVLSPWELVLN